MPDDNITFGLVQDTAENVDYSVGVDDGRTFRLSFTREILNTWADELSRSGRILELDPIVDRLAREIIRQEPSEEELSEGFVVTMDNAFATPTAAEQNLKNSGVLPFLAHRERIESPPPSAMP